MLNEKKAQDKISEIRKIGAEIQVKLDHIIGHAKPNPEAKDSDDRMSLRIQKVKMDVEDILRNLDKIKGRAKELEKILTQ